MIDFNDYTQKKASKRVGLPRDFLSILLRVK